MIGKLSTEKHFTFLTSRTIPGRM